MADREASVSTSNSGANKVSDCKEGWLFTTYVASHLAARSVGGAGVGKVAIPGCTSGVAFLPHSQHMGGGMGLAGHSYTICGCDCQLLLRMWHGQAGGGEMAIWPSPPSLLQWPHPAPRSVSHVGVGKVTITSLLVVWLSCHTPSAHSQKQVW